MEITSSSAAAQAPRPETLLIRREGAVLHVTLNRPESRNAMSLAMVAELRAAVSEITDLSNMPLRLRGPRHPPPSRAVR